MSQPPIGNRSSCANLVVVLMLSSGANAEPLPLPLTLDAYVDRVLKDGLQARAAAAEVGLATAELEATAPWPNPSAEISRQANAAGVRAGETQDQLVVSIPLVLSGRLGLARDAAAKDVEASRARLSFARASLRHEATAAYLQVAAARRRIDVEKRALAALDPVVDAIVAREKAGEAAGYDRVRIELEKKRVEDQLAASVADEKRALASALALLGPDATSGVVVAEHDLARPILARDMSADAVAARGDVRALSSEAEAAQLQEDAAWRSLVPDPTLFGGGYLLDVGRPELGYGYAVGVEIPIPLFDNGQGARARAKARRSLAEAQQQALVHAARARLSAALAERTVRADRARRHDAEVIARANELLEITTAAYRAGGAELLALVDAERAQREASATSVELHLSARLAENDALLLAGVYDDAANKETRP